MDSLVKRVKLPIDISGSKQDIEIVMCDTDSDTEFAPASDDVSTIIQKMKSQ